MCVYVRVRGFERVCVCMIGCVFVFANVCDDMRVFMFERERECVCMIVCVGWGVEST